MVNCKRCKQRTAYHYTDEFLDSYLRCVSCGYYQWETTSPEAVPALASPDVIDVGSLKPMENSVDLLFDDGSICWESHVVFSWIETELNVATVLEIKAGWTCPYPLTVKGKARMKARHLTKQIGERLQMRVRGVWDAVGVYISKHSKPFMVSLSHIERYKAPKGGWQAVYQEREGRCVGLVWLKPNGKPDSELPLRSAYNYAERFQTATGKKLVNVPAMLKRTNRVGFDGTTWSLLVIPPARESLSSTL